jgi:hypothetical protein
MIVQWLADISTQCAAEITKNNFRNVEAWIYRNLQIILIHFDRMEAVFILYWRAKFHLDWFDRRLLLKGVY